MRDETLPSPDFYLGGRRESPVTDFGGPVRACHVVDRLEPAGPDGDMPRYLRVRVDPPLPGRDGPELSEVVLTERSVGDNLLELGDESPVVYVFEITDGSGLVDGRVAPNALGIYGWGDVARLPALLPRSREELFDRMFRLLQEFVRREGHADVPVLHDEGGERLGIWVSNLKYSQATGSLDLTEAERFEGLPGWKWLSGDDACLLGLFAAREGHTNVPLGHFEEGRPLGNWVQHKRECHARGGNWRLHPDDEAQLEAIPHWHW